jgi:hypothetical protein
MDSINLKAGWCGVNKWFVETNVVAVDMERALE